MARPRGPRLSVEPMDAALRTFNIDAEFVEGRLGMEIRRARSRGYYTEPIADEVACKVLKMHPIVIWGEEYMSVVHSDLGFTDDAPADDLLDPNRNDEMEVAA